MVRVARQALRQAHQRPSCLQVVPPLDAARLRARHGGMTPEAFHAAALALPGATFDIKWGADRVYSVGGKMFAHAGPDGDPQPKYMFKASDLAFEMLIERGVAKPAPYLARAKWVQLTGPGVLGDEELVAYLKEAHRIVAAKLPAAVKAGLA
jgi:predicted DNA-binding protein (MmcQ/YjbR family)